MNQGFPRCVADCGRMLLAREVTTGYRTLPLAVDTVLAHHYGAGGGFVVTYKGHQIVTFYGDGRIGLSIPMRGYLRPALCAIINSLLPHPYSLEQGGEGIRFRCWLLCRSESGPQPFQTRLTFRPNEVEELALCV